MQRTDEELMTCFQRGDSTCFNLLVWRWQKAVTNFVYRFIGDEEESRDITQKVFLQVYKHAGKYKPTAKFSTWLYRIAINLCKNWIKKKKLGLLISLNKSFEDRNGEAYNLEDTLPDPSPSLDAQIHQREVEHLIKKAILSLSEDQRVVVIMRQYQELPFAEIASVLDCPISTVKSRMHYALNHLRKILQGYGIDEYDY